MRVPSPSVTVVRTGLGLAHVVFAEPPGIRRTVRRVEQRVDAGRLRTSPPCARRGSGPSAKEIDSAARGKVMPRSRFRGRAERRPYPTGGLLCESLLVAAGQGPRRSIGKYATPKPFAGPASCFHELADRVWWLPENVEHSSPA